MKSNQHLILFLMLLIPVTMVAQKKSPVFTADYLDRPLVAVLTEIEKSTGVFFYYDISEIDSSLVTASFNNLAVDSAISRLMKAQGFYWSRLEPNYYFISRKRRVRTALGESNFQPAIAAAQTNPDEIGDPLKVNNDAKATISGYVRDEKTGEPITGVSIRIEKNAIGVVTDDYGYYSFTLPKGRHQLTLQSVGMEDSKKNIVVHGDGEMDFELRGIATTLKHVIVSAQKVSNVKGTQLGVQKIDISQIRQVPVAFGEADVLKVVTTLPGVKTVGEASTGLNVRGGSADQNLILFNEATIYNPSHFFGLFSAFNPDVVRDVVLYKSTIPARYGGRLSSVLDISSREGNKKNISGSIGVGPLTSRLTIEGPIKKEKTTFILGGRTTYANWLLNLLPKEYENSKANFYDANLLLTHEVDKKNTLFLTGYMSSDRFNLNSDTIYRYQNTSASLKWKHIYSNKLNSIFSTGIDRYKFAISSDRNPVNAYQLDFSIEQYYFRAHANYYLNADHTVDFGVNTLYYKLLPGNYGPVGGGSLVKSDRLPEERALESAAYLNDRYDISSTITAEAGVRVSFYQMFGSRFVAHYGGSEYRVSLRKMIGLNSSVKAGFNTQRQYIHMLSNTAATAPTDIWKLSDPNIRPQRGAQVSLGFYRNLKSNTIEASVEVYYKKISDYLDYKSGANLVMNPAIEEDVVNTKGKAYGAEFLLKKSTGKLNGWVSYTWSRILLKQDDASAGEIINSGAYYPANYDKPHDFTLIANYRINHRFSISFNSTSSTGRPITLPIGRFYYSGSYRTLYADRNAHRIPDYFRSDFSMNIDGNHRVKQKTHNSWTIGVYNVTGRKNPYSVYYVSQAGTINGYKLSIFGSAIPFVSFNVKF